MVNLLSCDQCILAMILILNIAFSWFQYAAAGYLNIWGRVVFRGRGLLLCRKEMTTLGGLKRLSVSGFSAFQVDHADAD
jgi:hypothetical protein